MRTPAVLLALLLSACVETPPEPIDQRDSSEVLDLLAHPNPAVRMRAANELGRRRTPEALAPLTALLDDPEAAVRAQAAEALRALGDRGAVPALAGRLRDGDPTVRCRAAVALGALGGAEAVADLVPLLADPEPTVRAAAVLALGEAGSEGALEDVLGAQAAEPLGGEDPIAACAIVAAAKLGGPPGLARSLDLAAPRLPGNWLLRAAAAHAVGVAGDRTRIPMVRAWFLSDEEPRVAQAAAGALAALSEQAVLVEGIQNRDAFRRRAAVAALAGLPGPEASAALLRAARDRDPLVVLEAGTGLLGHGEVEAIPLLIGLLSVEYPDVWMGAMSALEARTGLDYGRDPAKWDQWFADRRADLTFDAARGTFSGVD